ncbi:MAG: PAS domain S-box protein [Balneola sp.]
MRNIDSQILKLIESCSKDKGSQEKLKEFFSIIADKRDEACDHLALLENAIKHDYDSILITELELDRPGPRIVYVNDGFTKMTGYSKEEVIGKTPRILQGEKTDNHVLERLKKRLVDGQAFFGHTINYKKDGTEFINQWDIHPLTDREGNVTHWVSYQRDITDRQETSKYLFDRNVDFESLEEDIQRTFVDLDVQGNIIASNKTFRESVGLDADQLKEVKIWDLVDDTHESEVKNLFQEFDPSAKLDDHYTWKFDSERDEELILESDIRCFEGNDQTLVRIHFDNVSLRNRVIEALKKKTDNLEDLLESQNEFVLKFKKDEHGKIYCSYVSESYKNITGLSQADILKKGLTAVVTKKTSALIEDSIEKALNGSLCSEKCEYIARNGDTISMIQSFKPIRDKKNEEIKAVKSVALVELKE